MASSSQPYCPVAEWLAAQPCDVDEDARDALLRATVEVHEQVMTRGRLKP